MPQAIGILAGIAIALMGVYMAISGNPSLLHGYHRATTPPEELAPLARESGAGIIIAGGEVDFLPTWCGAAMVLIGCDVALLAIVRHNGGLVTSPVASGTTRLAAKPRRDILTAVVITLVALVLIGTGGYMLVTGDVSPLHAYHYADVAAGDLRALATGVGAGAIAMGAGIALCAVSYANAAKKPAPAWTRPVMVLGAVALIAGMLATLLFIVRYNGAIFA